MVQIRQATETDLIEMQNTNLLCLPENYNLRYYLYHILSWPHLLMVAIDQGKVVGYVLAKLADDDDEQARTAIHGHITSLSVLRSHRKLGIATKLMKAAEAEMARVYEADAITLHVRKSNSAAFHLYSQTLGYTIVKLEVEYYADGEDAYEMKLKLNDKPDEPEKPKIEAKVEPKPQTQQQKGKQQQQQPQQQQQQKKKGKK